VVERVAEMLPFFVARKIARLLRAAPNFGWHCMTLYKVVLHNEPTNFHNPTTGMKKNLVYNQNRFIFV